MPFSDFFEFFIIFKPRNGFKACFELIQCFYASPLPLHVDAHTFSLPSRGKSTAKNKPHFPRPSKMNKQIFLELMVERERDRGEGYAYVQTKIHVQEVLA